MQQYHAAVKASDNNAIYRVVNNRNRNVAKSEAAMQTETVNAAGRQIQPASAAAVDWKQAMAHNARVLSSQEKAMDEYLKRQRLAAEQQLARAKPPPHPAQVKISSTIHVLETSEVSLSALSH